MAVTIISAIIGYKFLRLSSLDENSISQVKQFMSWDGNINDNGSLVFADAFKSNSLMILAIWISGLTFIGVPLIISTLFLKGFSFGFALAFVTQLNGEPGFYKIMVLLILQNVFIFSFLLLAAVFSLKLSLNLSKRKENLQKDNLSTKIKKHASCYVMVMALCFIEALMEGYILPLIF